MVASKQSRRRPTPLVGKSLVRKSLRRDGMKHGITLSAFETLSFLGKSFLEKVVMKAKTELNYSAKPNSTPASISVGTIIHACNCLGVPSVITKDAKEMVKRQTYDKACFKRSNVHKLVKGYCGKNRVRNNTATYLWCVVSSLLDEVISQSVTPVPGSEDKNIRVKNEHIYKVIREHPEQLLDPLKSFVGNGVALGPSRIHS